MTRREQRMLAALERAAVIMAVDRARAVTQGRDDTVGASVLALVRAVIAESKEG